MFHIGPGLISAWKQCLPAGPAGLCGRSLSSFAWEKFKLITRIQRPSSNLLIAGVQKLKTGAATKGRDDALLRARAQAEACPSRCAQ